MSDPAFLAAILSAGVSQCSLAAGRNGGLLVSMVAGGLVGSLSHCTGMCGPFVLSQVTSRLQACPIDKMREWRRLSGAALIPYHLGRATTYAGLGAAAAAVAGGVVHVSGIRWISAALLVAAALFFLGASLRRLPFHLGRPRSGARSGWWTRHVSALARPLFAAPTGWRGYLLGVALGFIPCGLLYGALAAAASASSPLGGALAMLAFAAGTVPALLAVGLAGHVMGRSRGGFGLLGRAVPALMLLNAALLGWLAWRIVA